MHNMEFHQKRIFGWAKSESQLFVSDVDRKFVRPNFFFLKKFLDGKRSAEFEMKKLENIFAVGWSTFWADHFCGWVVDFLGG